MNITEITNEILDLLKTNKSLTVVSDSSNKVLIVYKEEYENNCFSIVERYDGGKYGFYVSDDGEYLIRFDDKTEKSKQFKIKYKEGRTK